MKLSSFSKFSNDLISADSPFYSTPLSPTEPCFKPCFKTAERAAGQEIHSILQKGARTNCAAPLPARSPPIQFNVNENDSDEDDFFIPSCRPFASQKLWFAASPTRMADGTSFDDLSERKTLSRPMPCFAEQETPNTMIVGTPPCRAGNPMVNDTQFLTRRADCFPEARRTSIGCELGLFRLSPPAF